MSKTMIYERDPRSHEEIMKAARQMRADYIRELFGKLRAALTGHDGHGTILTPHAR
ncbi:hypothetical protein J2847_000714 [Azospirillum agricola]|uniref:RSP_7527 family protein n=1 Tax=Azospirillum agricola TaxID=1720247 RepID=UPI001AE2A0BA|nr:hypothetical protein [Azospirillum agricola]MBP2227434.1 hypothetical protein [Azospirillum agricola]